MNVVTRKSMTVEAFLAWEERQELRYAFDGFEPVAMTGGPRGIRRSSGTLFSL